jgi:hypothetical protein
LGRNRLNYEERIVKQTAGSDESFIRYIINAPHTKWWTQFGAPFLQSRNWHVLEPSNFSYKSSYGFDPVFVPVGQIANVDCCLKNAVIVVEYHGNPPNDSVLEPSIEKTIIDDLLAFTSIYFGGYCQYLWKEIRQSGGQWSSSLALMIDSDGFYELAAPPERAIEHFEKALSIIQVTPSTRLRLAIQWFFSALRELKIGRPLVEAALNWYVLSHKQIF